MEGCTPGERHQRRGNAARRDSGGQSGRWPGGAHAVPAGRGPGRHGPGRHGRGDHRAGHRAGEPAHEARTARGADRRRPGRVRPDPVRVPHRTGRVDGPGNLAAPVTELSVDELIELSERAAPEVFATLSAITTT